ncbi:hypothetical protein BH09ACT8_BH09ACT8_01130 [soil metagenome]
MQTVLAFSSSMRRPLLVIGTAATAAAIILGVLAAVSPAIAESAKCPAGESEDLYTGVCVPELSPSIVELTPSVFGGAPEVDGVVCTGHNTYECIGLAEQSLGSGPTPSANATVSAQTGTPATGAPTTSTSTGSPTGQDVTLTPDVAPPPAP